MFFKDLFFPRICLSCGYLGSYICLACQRKLVFFDHDICLYCLRRSYLGITHPGCRRPKGIDAAIFVYHYNTILKKIIKNIKYRLVKEGFDELLKLSFPIIQDKLLNFKRYFDSFHLQPIPLHERKLNQRGFNQSKVIADFIGSYFDYSSLDILTRIKNTAAQAQLPHGRKRYDNVRGAFSINNDYKIYNSYNNILLIDDVLTTGSTVKEATRVMKQNGIEKVYVFALAKG